MAQRKAESDFHIAPVQNPDDLGATIALIKAYVEWLGIDLSYQNFEEEMASMPGQYAPPKGALFLARSPDGQALGCVGLRQLGESGNCEMKRLFVDPKGRGLGLGRALGRTVIAEAKRIGYEAMMLDTLSTMESARALYKSLGFVEVEPYYDTPVHGTNFLRLDLKEPGSGGLAR